MKQLLFISFFFALFSCKGQKGSSAKVSVVDEFVGYYNRGHYDSVFNLFSPSTKEALPLKETKDYLSLMQSEGGNIIKYTFIDKKEGFDRYRADFSKGIYWLGIAADTKNQVAGYYFTYYNGPDLTVSMTRNTTKLSLPFHGEWFVFWGGDTEQQNYHVINRAQKNAFDILMVDAKGGSFKTNGKTNEDYYAFGQPLIAPCDAEVVTVIEGVKDNIPGEMNPAQVTGNSVVLKTAANEYLLFAHFKLNSIKVKKGDKVKQGQELGLCGNSGNTSEPHLHFHLQDKETMAGATGIKCYFDKITVNGKEITDYSPVKGERIRNAD